MRIDGPANSREAARGPAVYSFNDEEALNNAGSALAEFGYYAEAEKFYLRSIELDPNYEIGLRNLGNVLMAMGDYTGAELVFARVVSLNPKDMNSRWARIEALDRAERHDDRREALTELLGIAPNDARAYRELGMMYSTSFGDPIEGRKHLLKSLELNPDQPDIRRMLAEPARTPGRSPFEVPGLPALPNAAPRLPKLGGVPN